MKYADRRQCAEAIGVSVTTFDRMKSRPGFPPQLADGRRWILVDVVAWFEAPAKSRTTVREVRA